MKHPTLILRRGKTAAIERKHPWVFSGAIYQLEGDPKEGDWITIADEKRNVLGWGLYEAEGGIRARLVSFESELDTETIWQERIREAWELRERLGLLSDPDTNCCRLVFGEGDQLPGLVIDRYGPVAVMQCHNWGMYRNREAIAQALMEIASGHIRAVYGKSKEALPNIFRDQVEDGWLVGEENTVVEIVENGHRFTVDIQRGQKTGFFLDQRENRQELARWVDGKRVLNLFSYSGGFSIYAGKAGATEVVGVDSARAVVEQADQHAALNALDPETVSHVASDVFDFLKTDNGDWDVIVCDPPAFAKSTKARHNALMDYKRLNKLVLEKLKPGGVLFTFSCSQVVTPELFEHTVRAAGLEANRPVRILKTLRQPPDHPINLFHPEGAYLKGLVLAVS